jgi:NAD(P)H-nitrite reductase large subunit
VREGAKYMGILLKHGVPYKTGWSIQEACGEEHVEKSTLTQVDRNGKPVAGSQLEKEVDLVVSGYSLTPNTGLARMLGCQMDFQAEKGGWIALRNERMQSSLPGVYIVGDGAGIGGAENAEVEGKIAGNEISLHCGRIDLKTAQESYQQYLKVLLNQKRFGKLYGDLFTPPDGLIGLANDDTILCRCEEVTLGEVKKAVAMGAKTIGEVKMLTRSGMGNCQGRMCEHTISAAIVEALAAEYATPKSVGHYSIRPPLHPLPSEFLANAQKDIDQLD